MYVVCMSIYNIMKSANSLNLNDCANQLLEKRLFNEILNTMTSMLSGIVLLCFNVMRLRYLLITLTLVLKQKTSLEDEF